jgi:mono/diheme cytochrome c family protein
MRGASPGTEGTRMRGTGSMLMTVTALVLTAVFSRVEGQTQPPKVVEKPATAISSVAGSDTFREYCAVCHGIGGRGNGPAAPALKVPPPDLTMLQKRNDKSFPEDKIRAMLLGQRPLPSHGSADMPIWGPIFRDLEDKAVTTLRIGNVIKYIRAFQVMD